MTMSQSMIEYGRAILASGELVKLRERLGLTRAAMAELLHTTPPSYRDWEEGVRGVRNSSAERIGRFYTIAERMLDELDEDLSELLPFHVAASNAGLPQEILLRLYREGQVPGVDLGILGLWIHIEDLDKLQLNQDLG